METAKSVQVRVRIPQRYRLVKLTRINGIIQYYTELRDWRADDKWDRFEDSISNDEQTARNLFDKIVGNVVSNIEVIEERTV